MWLRERDVILIDQRGIGLSRPELDFPELDNLQFGNDISENDAEAQTMETISSCNDRLLSQGVDLSMYAMIANTNDVANVLLALDYEQANYFELS